jgi:hypothetical protein
LRILEGCVGLAHRLGIDGHALRRIIADGYEDLARAAEAVLSAFRAKYRDETEFAEKLEPFENRLRGRRRDALVDYLIRSVHPEFESTSDLFHHFLIDVELEGCARTSRVAAAISSLQLYVHRIRMNLEQDRRDPADPQRVHIPPDSIPMDEWTWRKNYRVWEANRKVFLYPESYIEPDLRDNKTPLFQELESTLLQQEINEQTVLDAYARYLSGFEEIARLKIAGSYHDKNYNSRTDILHLFGVTSDDPPIYYYRTAENLHFGAIFSDRPVSWAAWRKIDVQIPVRTVSPVVYRGQLYVFWIEITTIPQNEVIDATSSFVAYKHKTSLKFTKPRLDGAWLPAQHLSLQNCYRPEIGGLSLCLSDGVVEDRKDDSGVPQYSGRKGQIINGYFEREYFWEDNEHKEPIESYSLKGFQWEQPYPCLGLQTPEIYLQVYCLSFATIFNFSDIFTKKVTYNNLLGNIIFNRLWWSAPSSCLCSKRDDTGRRYLYLGQPEFIMDPYAQCAIMSDERRIWMLEEHTHLHSYNIGLNLYTTPIANLENNDDISVINGSPSWAFISRDGDNFLLQEMTIDYSIQRMGTGLIKALDMLLSHGGVDGLLATTSQQALKEPSLTIDIINNIRNRVVSGKMDFSGSLGVYFREIFFHVPFLIANHLNSQQRFAAAQRWYHFILDPTASETTVPATDRVWRYIEFRGLGVPALREILEDPKALGVYLKDPFNPHAIARLRLSAYQKTIYMKYIDNLLDWGDSLYTQYTAEAINEAMLLYVLASDMLGPRPAELGECGEGAVEPTYEIIAPAIGSQVGTGPAPILIELENRAFSGSGTAAMVAGGGGPGTAFMIDRGIMVSRLGVDVAEPGAEGALLSAGGAGIARPYDWNRTITGGWTTRAVSSSAETGGAQPATPSTMEAPDRFIDVPVRLVEMDRPDSRSRSPGFARSVVAAMGGAPAFCVPENKELRQYWDRVEDRLFKIRNCMDIAGVRRELALFAPEIDPRLLVRARAAGLSLEDVLNAINGDLPPYRFTYLIEKAKAYAATLQGFGSALLGAIERRDSEELNRLRTVHQQNILELSTKLRDIEIETASEAYDQLYLQEQATEYRMNYYKGLRDGSLTPWERTQQISRHAASALGITASMFSTVAGMAYLVPQLGSPFTLEYGGKEMGDAASAQAMAWRGFASVAEAVGASAGLEAGFERRDEGWEHQQELAQRELGQIEKQKKIAELRKDTAARSKEIHDETVKQIEEVYAFNQERFSNFGLYTYLSATLQGVFREAYNNALAMARLAEQAYRFERGDDQAPVLQPSYWETGKAGLLAGEKLFIDLQNLERRFLETNYRSLEIDQPFSLSQINPAALLQLKQNGECTFSLPEVFFDLFYPGQYRRRIRSVRLTIPCVTGPFTNVGATLSLTGSSIRREPKLGAVELKPVPLRRSVTIASSTAQNDAGVFEFSFRDERYMPFEGAGAISDWTLSLPKAFKPFDYQTITDVILHVSYTAEYDGRLRGDVEQQNAVLEGAILNVLSNVSLTRAFSLRQDFSTAFQRLLHSPADTEVKFAISDAFLPYFLKRRSVVVTAIKLGLRTAPDPNQPDQLIDPGTFEIALDGNPALGNFTKDANLGNLWAQNGRFVPAPPNHPLGKLLGEHSLRVKRAGALAPQAPQPGDPSAIDADKLLDAILYVEYHI